jgi:hypothetical protein
MTEIDDSFDDDDEHLQGKHYFLERNQDNYLLYCQKNALKFGPALSQFFTAIQLQVWILFVFFSLVLYLTNLGGGNGLELIASLLKQPLTR